MRREDRHYPTPDELNQLFTYNPETGELRRKLNRRGTVVGSLAGCQYRSQRMRSDRIIVGVNYYQILAHRIIWAMMTGEWPKEEIDHINGNGADNRWENLREATHSQNVHNVKIVRTNTTGFKGVYYHKRAGKYAAQIMHERKHYYLGLHDTAEAAADAREAMANILHQTFANHD